MNDDKRSGKHEPDKHESEQHKQVSSDDIDMAYRKMMISELRNKVNLKLGSNDASAIKTLRTLIEDVEPGKEKKK